MSRPSTNQSHVPKPSPTQTSHQTISDHIQRTLTQSLYQSHDPNFTRKPSLLSGYHNTEQRYNAQNQGMSTAAAAAVVSAIAANANNQNQMYNSTNVATAAAIAAANSYIDQMSGANGPSRLMNQQRPGQQPLSYSQSTLAAVVSAMTGRGINPNHPQYAQLLNQQFQMIHKNESVKKEPIIPSVTPQPHTATQPQILSAQKQSSIQANSYVPVVEAISPTPEDQKENSNLQEFKDKLISDIERVEKDIASTQYQFDLIKKKQFEIDQEKFNQIDGNFLNGKNLTLAERIYMDNKVSSFVVIHIHRSIITNMPFLF